MPIAYGDIQPRTGGVATPGELAAWTKPTEWFLEQAKQFPGRTYEIPSKYGTLDKILEAYNAYAASGGRLTYDEWRDEGEPSAVLPREVEAYESYLASGGTLSHDEWFRQGRPSTMTTQERLEQAPLINEQFAVYQASGGALSIDEWIAQGKPPSPSEDEFAPPTFPTEPPPEGYEWVWDSSSMQYILNPKPTASQIEQFGEEPEGRYYYDDAGNLHQVSYVLTSKGWDQQDNVVQFAQREELPRQPTTYEPFGTDPYGGQGQFNPYTGQWEAPPGYVSPSAEPQWRPGELELQQQQMAQQAQWQAWQQAEAQRQYGSQLAAQPHSWLEYAAYTGEQPAIQPWMLPLMPQQYQGMGAGQGIPGWQAPQAGQMEGMQGMAGLPTLTRPSRQYQARMGPTAMAQHSGYQQAKTGARPEETAFRLWSAAPPGGTYQGLSYAR